MSVVDLQGERVHSQAETSFFRNVAAARHELDDALLGESNASSPLSSPELSDDGSRTGSVVSLESPSSPFTPADAQSIADSFVFAFDIDGVLVRGGSAIPEAIEAMRVLDGQNEHGIKV
jgi:hypothetical protein